MPWNRIAPVTGIVAVVLTVVAFIIGGEPPDADAPAREVVSYYADNETEVGVASVLLALGAAFLLFFFITLGGWLRRAEARASALSIGVVAGATLTAVGLLIFAGFGLTLSEAGPDLEPAAAQAIHAMSEDMWFPVAGGTVVLSWSVALAILRNGGLPRWLGWVALVIAIASVTPLGFFAFLATGLWALVASVLMVARPEAS